MSRIRIDLDAVRATTPVVEWHGEEFEVADVSVGEIIALSQRAQEAREEGETMDVWQDLLGQARALLPGAPPAFWDDLGFRQLMVMINAIVHDATALDPTRYMKGLEQSGAKTPRRRRQ